MRLVNTPGRSIRLTAAAGAVVAAVLALAACGGGGGGKSTTTAASSAATTSAVKQGGTLTFALDEDLAGFNILNASQSEFVLAEIVDQVWPSVYIVQPSLKPVLDTQVVTSAKLTKKTPQTVVYQINPKAKWSDGVADQRRRLHLQLAVAVGQLEVQGRRRQAVRGRVDLGLQPDPVGDGLERRQDRDRRLLEAVRRLEEPLQSDDPGAHLAEGRLQRRLVVVRRGGEGVGRPVRRSRATRRGRISSRFRNPHFWGHEGASCSKLVFRFILDDSQQAPAVQNGEVNMVNPALPGLDYYDSLKSISGFKLSVEPGSSSSTSTSTSL